MRLMLEHVKLSMFRLCNERGWDCVNDHRMNIHLKDKIMRFN